MATKSTKAKKNTTTRTKSKTTKPKKIEVKDATKVTVKTQTKPVKNTTKTKKTASDTMGKKIIKLIICIAVPLAVGGASALLTGDMMARFNEFEQPILSPPGWLFPIAWTILYILMGLASFFILQYKPTNKVEKSGKVAWLVIYGVQLVFNFMWSIFFFVWNMFSFALFWLLAMWVMILVLVFMANRHSQAAMWCMLPYALWVTFAAYLNLMIMMLN